MSNVYGCSTADNNPRTWIDSKQPEARSLVEFHRLTECLNRKRFDLSTKMWFTMYFMTITDNGLQHVPVIKLSRYGKKCIERLRQNSSDVLELRMIQLCIYFRVDLGSEWKRCMDCVGQLESAFRIRVAFIMGTSRIWNRFGNMLIRSHCFGMGGNNWWKANTNNDTS